MLELCLQAVVILAPLQIDPDIGGGDDCPGTGSCCTDHGLAGCNNTECCELVCAQSQSCCSIGWSQPCVNLALELCGNHCPAFLCPSTGDCCDVHPERGCEDRDCCTAVCTVNSSCCRDGWSAACVTLAGALCDPLCDFGPGCPGNGLCCFENGSPGCDDPACCAAVCAADSFCCSGLWDNLCAEKANDLCGEANGTYCEWCPAEESCCEGHGTPGCDRGACCELICSMGSRCCTVFWDSGCADAAAKFCPASACGCALFGDLDEDDMINLRDAARFFTCFTGDGISPPLAQDCYCGDGDGDGTVNIDDYDAFAPFFVSE